MYRLLLATTAAAFTASVAIAQAQPSAEIKAPDGKVLGQATFRAAPSDGVLVQIQVSGLTPGWHGLQFHAKGDCSDPKFMTSGAHINHADMPHKHGLLNAEGPDMGDLPNLFAAADGTAQAQVFTGTVAWDGPAGLKDADGSALVIHANADDGVTQPIGGAGDRVACAVIR